MGRKLDVLLGRTSKQTARLKTLLALAVTRLAVLRGHREVRRAQARGDVEQLLRLGHHDRALLRAEQVIREQNMIDVFLMLESYCSLIDERAALVDAHRDCPSELREAAAGLVYAAVRCGDLPELQEVRALLAAKFGRDFAAAAAELRSGCGINTKIVQKLSTKPPTPESRQMVLCEIAEEKGITVPDFDSSGQRKKQDGERRRTPHADMEIRDSNISADPSPQRYKDVEAAAQAAFESAATAAAAAKAAIELSRADSTDPDDRSKPGRLRSHAVVGVTKIVTLHGDEELEIDLLPEIEAGDGDIEESKQARSKPVSVRTKRGL